MLRRYEELWGQPPRVKHRQHLWRRCAWKHQERRLGGLSGKARERLDRLVTDIDLPLEGVCGSRIAGRVRPSDPPVGTVLERRYKGRKIRATVLDRGVEIDGVVYSSLTAAARAVTGSAWNGRLFFGLTKRSQK